MTILFVGGEISAFTSSGTPRETTGGSYNTTFARCALDCDGSVGDVNDRYVETAHWTGQTGDLYLHFEASHSEKVGTNICVIYDSSDVSQFRLIRTSGNIRLDYKDSLGAWQAGASTIAEPGGRTDFDIYVNKTTGDMALFVAGVRRITETGLSLSHMAGLSYARFFSSLRGSYYSQVIAADVPTIGKRLATGTITGAGATNSFTYGSYTGVDEIVISDADFVYSDTAGQSITFAQTVPTLTGYNVVAVGVAVRALRGGSGPQNMRILLRSGSTNYDNGSDIALDVGYTAKVAIWETDPATGVAWVNANVSSVQPGVKSIA